MVSFPSSRSREEKSPKPGRAAFCRGRQPYHIVFFINRPPFCFTGWAPPFRNRIGFDLDNKNCVLKLVKLSAQEALIGIFPVIYPRGICSFTLSGRNPLMLKIWPGLSARFRSYEWHPIGNNSTAESDEACAAIFWARGCGTTHALQDLCSTKKPGDSNGSGVCLVPGITYRCSAFSPSSVPKHFCSDWF